MITPLAPPVRADLYHLSTLEVTLWTSRAMSSSFEDIVAYLERLAPASDTYKHNDLHLRPASEKDRQAIDRNWMSQAGEALVIDTAYRLPGGFNWL